MPVADETDGAEPARIYRFLAGVFSSAPRAESARDLSRTARTLGIGFPDEPSLADLDRDFLELFVIPNPRYLAPYESVYRDAWLLPLESGPDATSQTVGRLLMGESTAAMRTCFLEAGVLPSQDLPDHFGNELRLLSHLCAADDPGSGRQEIRQELRIKVLNEHLLTAAPVMGCTGLRARRCSRGRRSICAWRAVTPRCTSATAARISTRTPSSR